MIVDFKIERGVYYVDDEEYCEDERTYGWDVPVDIEREAITYVVSDYYGLDYKKLKSLLDDFDEMYDELEEEFEDDVEEYIKDNYEDEAMADFNKEYDYNVD